MNAPTHVPMVVRAIKALQFVYDVMPPELRLMLATQVAQWADNARALALAQLGRSQQAPPASTEPERTTYTTTGYSHRQ
jgi:hypothetical protein